MIIFGEILLTAFFIISIMLNVVVYLISCIWSVITSGFNVAIDSIRENLFDFIVIFMSCLIILINSIAKIIVGY